MMTICKETFTDLFANLDKIRVEPLTAGTKYRMKGLAADNMELAATLQAEVLQLVSQEAVLDADVDIDYAEMSEMLLAKELEEGAHTDAEVRDACRWVNESIGALSEILMQIDGQLSRHHKDEEYERLYEAEKRRYLNSGTSKRSRQTFAEWRDDTCYGHPSVEEIEDYRMEKLLQMFEKGVFDRRVEHIQRAKRYANEVDFDTLDDDHPLKKSVHKHYAALRKMADFRDGCLMVDPVRMGQYFYSCRHEDNAKARRTHILKYLHKIELAQEEYCRLSSQQRNEMEPQPRAEEEPRPLPDVLATDLAMKYWKRLQEAGFVDCHYQLSANTTRKQAMYMADAFSDKLRLRSKWKPFQDFWHINNLAQEKWEMQETGKTPSRADEMERIFNE